MNNLLLVIDYVAKIRQRVYRLKAFAVKGTERYT